MLEIEKLNSCTASGDVWDDEDIQSLFDSTAVAPSEERRIKHNDNNFSPITIFKLCISKLKIIQISLGALYRAVFITKQSSMSLITWKLNYLIAPL